MNIKVFKYNKYILLEYNPQNPDFLWKKYGLDGNDENTSSASDDDEYQIKDVFFVDKQLYENSKIKIFEEDNSYLDLDDTQPESFYYIIAEEEGDFFKFDKNILQIDFNLFIQKSININYKLFIKQSFRSVSVFKPFNNFYKKESLYVIKEESAVPSNNMSITIKKLEYLIGNIPNDTELIKYTNSRFTSVLKNILEVDDMEEELKKYVDKKLNYEIKDISAKDQAFKTIDKKKYEAYLIKLESMVANHTSYSEADWQKEILKIFTVINPKYIHIGEKLYLKSFFDNSRMFTDIVLVDYNGNIDLMEIKKPFEELFYSTLYRKNYIPTKELQGTCMQLQNYLISLEKTNKKDLNKSKFKKKNIPSHLTLNATMPKGYVLFGLDEQLVSDPKARKDFQILRNMYSNIIDIITYDDLIQRYKNVIRSMQ
jgi:hypothetical protein